MFPNPQDALPLPPRPNLEQYKKQAEDLVKACRGKKGARAGLKPAPRAVRRSGFRRDSSVRKESCKSGDRGAIGAWAANWVKTLVRSHNLTIAPQLPVRIDRWIDEVEEFARRKLLGGDAGRAKCALADAQFVIARSHGFQGWPKLAKHIGALARGSSAASQFEAAADAIIAGDAATLEWLLRQNPELIRARSTREHRATLLHYVSANGVEGYRQKSPKNAVKMAEILLKAGAEVDAEADVYGGGATTLGLVATSIHPERAGVQNALMRVLLDHGAAIDRPGVAGNQHRAVRGCLANGRGQAAGFLAKRGARLDLEEAAGVGRLDVVKGFFNEDGSLKANATKVQMERGFLWACEYGRNSAVEFLLQKGVDLRAQADTGETGLHWAVIGGQLKTIKLLLKRGASLEAKNAYGGTALGQALWSAINGDPGIDYVSTIEALIDAGAEIEPGSLAWLAQQKGGSAAVKARIAAVLRTHGATS